MPTSTPRRLHRSRTQRLIAGVCGGLAEYFDLDPTVVRLAFVVLVFAWFSGVVLYFVLAIIMPLEGKEEAQPDLGVRVKETAGELKATAEKFTRDVRKTRRTNGNQRPR